MSQQSKQDIASLFQQQGQALGLDPDSSGILIHNLNASTMPLCQGSPFTDEEEDTDDFRIIMFCLDSSGSMQNVESALIDSFNEIIIPALLGGALNVVGSIRIGGLKFATRVHPLWGGGFHPITELPVLTTKDYKADGYTALNRGVLDAVTAAAAYALQIRDKTGTNPETVFACLSDGANNQSPMDPDEVHQVLSKLSPELFTTVFMGFETYEQVDFRSIARSMGFRDITEVKAQPGESKDEQQRRFRHMMRVFSGSLVNRASTPQVGKKLKPDGSTGYWN